MDLSFDLNIYHVFSKGYHVTLHLFYLFRTKHRHTFVSQLPPSIGYFLNGIEPFSGEANLK